MTLLDILFWLLIVLMAGIAWAVASGLAKRHRGSLLSSLVASLATLGLMKVAGEGGFNLAMFGFHKPANGISAGDARTKAGEIDAEGIEHQRVQAAEEKPVIYSRVPFRDCPACPQIVIMPAGRSTIGSPSTEPGRQPGEAVARPQEFKKSFAIGRLEVTRGEFAEFASSQGYQSRTKCDTARLRGVFTWERPGFEQDERHPVVCVTREEVELYLVWLNGRSGRTYRLPTEAEWEHAARGGTDSAYSIGGTIRRVANIGQLRDGTTVGGLFVMNPWGLSDVIGNAWEMTTACSWPEPRDTVRALSRCQLVGKGGSWITQEEEGRHAARRPIGEGVATHDIGFRVVRDLDHRDADKKLSVAEIAVLEKADKDAAEIEAKIRNAEEEAQRKLREAAEADVAREAADIIRKAEEAKKGVKK